MIPSAAELFYFSTAFLSILAIILLWAAQVSWNEKEIRATKILLTASIFILAVIGISFILSFPYRYIIVVFTGFVFISTIILLLPSRTKIVVPELPETSFHDERDTIFSRRDLKSDTENYENYYRQNPEKKETDDYHSSLPGILSPDSLFYEPLKYAQADANFTSVEALYPLINGPVNSIKPKIKPDEVEKEILCWLKKQGAHSAGFCELKPAHFYHTRGRRKNYGKKTENTHSFAIAFSVEMDFLNVKAAPYAPIIVESSAQYLRSGLIAVNLAAFIRQLGYDARAHIDGNYEVICPIVARDAGLGEIGRMGLLMTPSLGPRVRIAVVTTELTLSGHSRKENSPMIHFCKICKKCSTNCPGNAIPYSEPQNKPSEPLWKINHEQCYQYWCKAGTDCGRCISVCPFSHPDNLLHRLVRAGIRNNKLFAQLALFLDDYLYGRKPKPFTYR